MSYDQFAEFGVRRRSISAALTEAEVLGFIACTRPGGMTDTGLKWVSRYRLTWLGTCRDEPPVYGWRAFKTMPEAKAAVARALKAQDPAERIAKPTSARVAA